MRETEILITGAGPAGASTALELLNASPEWANRITILDKATFPRKKVCGGGLTPFALQWLYNMFKDQWPPEELEVQWIREAHIRYQNSLFAYFGDPVLQIVERKFFDNWLLDKVHDSGIDIIQGVNVKDVNIHDDAVEVYTDNEVWRASVLVGADGANSIVRRRLGLHSIGKMSRLLETITPPTESGQYHKNQIALFDFTPMRDGLQGYYWDFPTIKGGQKAMNRGVFDSGIQVKDGKHSLRKHFEKILNTDKSLLSCSYIEGNPIYRFHPNYKPYCNRTLLVGDAAGSDPFLGEGIAFALHYGTAAAHAIIEAFKQNDFKMESYNKIIRNHPVLSQLQTRYQIARLGYGINNQMLLRLVWGTAPWIMGWQAFRKPSIVPLNNKRMYRL